MFPDNLLYGFLLIFALRVCDVSLGTVRMVFIVQGRKWLSAGIGFIEVMIFIVAISQVMGHLKSPWLMVAYAGGFATGNLVGVWIEGKLAFGYSQLRIISQGQGKAIAEELWRHDYGATVVPGSGRQGEVDLIFSIVPRRSINECIRLATGVDDDCFITVSDSRYFQRGHIGTHDKRK